MKKKKEKIKSAKKLKYEKFSKVDTGESKMKVFDVSKEKRDAAERSYSSALRLTQFIKTTKNKKTFKRFCKCCRSKTIFNRTKDDGVVCSVCGIKEGGVFNPTFSTEKLGVKIKKEETENVKNHQKI